MNKQQREQYFAQEYTEYFDRICLPPEELGLIPLAEPLTLHQKLAEELKVRDKFLKFSTICREDDVWFINMTIEKLDKEIKTLRNKIYRIEHPCGDGRIEKAKNIPINIVADMLGIQTKQSSGKRLVCSIRDEKYPSCTLYLENNSYYDFGTSNGGDVISFYMAVAGCDFREALYKLVPNI